MAKVKQIDLTQGNVMSNLVRFTLPFFLGFFLNSVYSAIDLIFIGNFGTPIDSVSVATGTTVLFLVNSVIQGIATGGTILIARCYGMKDTEKIEKSIKNTAIIIGLIGLISAVFLISFSWLIIDLLRVEDTAREVAIQYLMILSSGLIFNTVIVIASSILRGIGNSFAGMIFLISAALTNIGLDALFIIGFGWGAQGAALATVLGYVVGCIVIAIYLKIKQLPYRFSLKGWIDWDYNSQIFTSGLPISLQDGLVILSFSIILALMNSKGLIYGSTVGVTDRVTSFGFSALGAVANAIGGSVGQCIGAKDIKRAQKYIQFGFIISTTMALIFGGLCLLIPKQLAQIFAGSQPEVVEIAIPYIRSTSLDLFVCAMIFPMNAGFIGAGHTVFSLVHNIGSTFLVRVPFALVVAKLFDASVFVIGLAYPISSIFSLIACIIYYVKGYWKKAPKFQKIQND